MKAQQRHQLKQNEFASTVARAVDFSARNRDTIVKGIGAFLVVVVIAGAYFFWKRYREDQAGALLGIAMAMKDAPIGTALPTAAPSGTTYPNEQARSEATLTAFQKVVAEYPSTNAGLTARYHAALTLRELGKFGDAAAAFQQAIDHAGSSVYGTMSRLGMAECYVDDKQFDKAITIYNELSSQRDGPLPVDGVLIQLARAYAKAGKPNDARAAYKRIVDEFAESAFAADAKKEMAALPA